MAKIRIASANHEVEIESDDPAADLNRMARDLWHDTEPGSDLARGFGFTTGTAPHRRSVRRMCDPAADAAAYRERTEAAVEAEAERIRREERES